MQVQVQVQANYANNKTTCLGTFWSTLKTHTQNEAFVKTSIIKNKYDPEWMADKLPTTVHIVVRIEWPGKDNLPQTLPHTPSSASISRIRCPLPIPPKLGLQDISPTIIFLSLYTIS